MGVNWAKWFHRTRWTWRKCSGHGRHNMPQPFRSCGRGLHLAEAHRLVMACVSGATWNQCQVWTAPIDLLFSARASHANFIVAGCAITGEKRLFRDIPWPQEPARMRPARVATRKLYTMFLPFGYETMLMWAPHLPHSCLLGGSCSKRISKVHVQAEACMSSVDSIPKCWSEINIPKESSMKL
jgi:hypothetical protein